MNYIALVSLLALTARAVDGLGGRSTRSPRPSSRHRAPQSRVRRPWPDQTSPVHRRADHQQQHDDEYALRLAAADAMWNDDPWRAESRPSTRPWFISKTNRTTSTTTTTTTEQPFQTKKDQVPATRAAAFDIHINTWTDAQPKHGKSVDAGSLRNAAAAAALSAGTASAALLASLAVVLLGSLGRHRRPARIE